MIINNFMIINNSHKKYYSNSIEISYNYVCDTLFVLLIPSA